MMQETNQLYRITNTREENKSTEGKKHTFKNKSLPLSVKTRHLDVCMLDITEPSSIFCNPTRLSPSASLPEFDWMETSSAKTVLGLNPKSMAAKSTLTCQQQMPPFYLICSKSSITW